MRWLLPSMWFLLFDAPGEPAEFVHGTLQTGVRAVQINAVDEGSRLPPAPAGTLSDGRHHLQIPQQPGCRRMCLGLLLADLAAGLEEQRRIFENPRPHPGRPVAPGGIQFARLAAGELMGSECAGHLFAVTEIGARHRYEELHGHVRGDLALAYLLLDGVRKKFDQCQAPRNPALAPVKPPGQFVEAVAEALFEFHQQPALLQGGLAFRCPQRLAQQERFGLVHLPHGCTHRVAAQPPQSRDPLVTVDNQVAVRLVPDSHDHNRYLLARCRKRCQKSSLPVGTSYPQMLKTKIKLVKLKIHGDCPHRSTLPASDEAIAVSMQARDTLSRIPTVYPRSGRHLQMKAGA